uniref:FunJ4 n=1 Tax=Streptosporangium sp. KD35 TaxID=2162663 RepID=A0A2U9KD20_9ACTN|nr:FunJ4 [Streptosporangium sp. KD35]
MAPSAAGAVIGGLVGHFEVDVLERGAARRQLVDRDAMLSGKITDRGGVGARHRKTALRPERHRRAGALQDPAQLHVPRGPDQDVAAEAPGEVLHRGLGDQPAPPDDEHVVNGLGHLAHQMAGQQHRPAFRGERAHQVTRPADALGVQSVHRLVQENDAGITQQRRRDAQPLPHTERETPDALVRHVLQPHLLQQRHDPGGADAVAAGQAGELVERGAARVHRTGVEQRAHLVQRPADLRVSTPVDQGHAGRRVMKADDDAQGRGFPRAVGSQKAGHPPGVSLEGQPVQCERRAVSLCQLSYFDHMERVTKPPLPARLPTVGTSASAHGHT